MQLVAATISGAHGLKGHVKLNVRTDDPEARFQPGAVFTTNSREYPRLRITQVRHSGGAWQVAFAEVTDRTGAEGLRGTELQIETAEQEAGTDEWYVHELVGLPVRDTSGQPLGTVADVESGPAQDLLVVATDHGEVRVPFVAALVPVVGRDGVVVDPPGGLFDGEVDS